MDLPILEFTHSSKLCMIPFPVTFKTRLYFLFALLSRLLRDSLSCILSMAHPLLSCHTVLLPYSSVWRHVQDFPSTPYKTLMPKRKQTCRADIGCHKKPFLSHSRTRDLCQEGWMRGELRGVPASQEGRSRREARGQGAEHGPTLGIMTLD